MRKIKLRGRIERDGGEAAGEGPSDKEGWGQA